MDILLLTVSIVLPVITTLFLYQFITGKSNLPGRFGFPLIGENIDYFQKIRSGTNEKFLMERKKKYSSDVFKTSILGEKMAFLSGPEGNKFLFSNEDKLVQVWWPSAFEIFSKKSHNKSIKEESAKLRPLQTPYIRAQAVKNYVGTMDSVLREHLKDFWIGRTEVLVCPLVAKYTFSLAVRLFLSVNNHEVLEKLSVPFVEAARGMISIPINLPGTRFRRGIKASERFRKVVSEIIEQRRAELASGKATAGQDLLSHMIVEVGKRNENPDNAPTTDNDIACDVMGLLIAGYDPINTTLAFIMMTLVDYPDVYHQVLQEQLAIKKSKPEGELLNWDDLGKMKYSWNVACEMLRMRTPTTGTFRMAIKDFTYAGFTIPKGWKLHYIPHFTHKNPDYFPNPEKFDPSRFAGAGPAPYTFVPFGGGPRMCAGIEYSKADILVFMHHIVTLFKWEMSIPGEKVVFDPLPRLIHGLPIKLFPHKSQI